MQVNVTFGQLREMLASTFRSGPDPGPLLAAVATAGEFFKLNDMTVIFTTWISDLPGAGPAVPTPGPLTPPDPISAMQALAQAVAEAGTKLKDSNLIIARAEVDARFSASVPGAPAGVNSTFNLKIGPKPIS